MTSRLHRRRWLRFLRLSALPLWLALSSNVAAHAEFEKLSSGQPFSDVSSGFEASPNGVYAVYRHDPVTDNAYELYSVLLPGGTPVRLSDILPAGSAVTDFAITPDSQRVIFRADQETAGVTELFSVPIAGPDSASIKLNPALAVNGDIFPFELTLDGSRVIYKADQDVDGINELYSVPVAGPSSSAVKLNPALVAGGDIDVFELSADGTRVLYVADQDSDEVNELFSVPVAGPSSSAVKLNPALVAGGDVVPETGRLWADGSRAVFMADLASDETTELYSVPVSGPAGAAVKLNETLHPDGFVWSFKVNAPAGRVVYLAEVETVNVNELFSVPIAGPASDSIPLHPALVAGGTVKSNYLIAPDGTRVVYSADQEVNGVDELFSVPIAGPASDSVRLNDDMVAGGDVGSYRISPDSSWVVYSADQDFDEWSVGYRAPILGPDSASELLWLDPYCPGISCWNILPDSSAVVVLGNHTFVDGILRLWTVPLSGTPNPDGTDWLNGDLQPDGDVAEFQMLPNSSGTLYKADQEVDQVSELYVLYFRFWGDGFESGDTDRWSAVEP